jgi:hypothetical protein
MARPKFAPTTQQRRMLDQLGRADRDHAAKRERIDAELDQVIARAHAQEIPVSVIAETLGWTRHRVYRHLGRDI